MSRDRLNSSNGRKVRRGVQGLVLSRMIGETIMIGDDIQVTLLDIRGAHVRLAINAPKHVPVHRGEVFDAIARQRAEQTRHPYQRGA